MMVAVVDARELVEVHAFKERSKWWIIVGKGSAGNKFPTRFD
jgi:phage anti-repressor protein